MNIEALQGLFVDLVVRSTVLVTVIWLGLKLCQKRQASFRCGLLTVGMGGLLLLPLTWCLPRVEVSFLPSLSEPTELAIGNAALQASETSSLGSSLIVLWFVGIAGIALGQSVGMWQLQRWRDRSVALRSGYWQGLINDVCEALNYEDSVRLYRCPRIGSPAAAGLLRPCVFLPEDAVHWDAERLRVVLLHEIGHLKRRDLWTQWLSQTVCAVYWFHPMVWMLHRTLHETREFACDHTVLRTGTEPSHYARHLLALAKTLSQRPARPRLAMANGLFLAMAAPSTRQCALEQRVRAILSFQSTNHLPVLLGTLWVTAGLSTAWATATLTPMREEPMVVTPSSAMAVEADTEVYVPAELHWRVTADPFPGN